MVGAEMHKPAKKLKAVPSPAEWTPTESAELYGIRNWGAGYFDIADNGEVTICVPSNGGRVAVSVMDLIGGLQQRGLQMPVLLRIENLLDAQITLLNESFRRAIDALGYKAQYRGVYPIKVNQQQPGDRGDRALRRALPPRARGRQQGRAADRARASRAGLGHTSSATATRTRNSSTSACRRCRWGYKCFFVLEMPGELPIILERAAGSASARCSACASSSLRASRATGPSRAAIAASSA